MNVITIGRALVLVTVFTLTGCTEIMKADLMNAYQVIKSGGSSATSERPLYTYDSRIKYEQAYQAYEASGQSKQVLKKKLSEICEVNPDALFDLLLLKRQDISFEYTFTSGQNTGKTLRLDPWKEIHNVCGTLSSEYVGGNSAEGTLVSWGYPKIFNYLVNEIIDGAYTCDKNYSSGLQDCHPRFSGPGNYAEAEAFMQLADMFGYPTPESTKTYVCANRNKNDKDICPNPNSYYLKVLLKPETVSGRYPFSRNMQILPYQTSQKQNGCTPQTCTLTDVQVAAIETEKMKIAQIRQDYQLKIAQEKSSHDAAEVVRKEQERIDNERRQADLAAIQDKKSALAAAYNKKITDALKPDSTKQYVTINPEVKNDFKVPFSQYGFLITSADWLKKIKGGELGAFNPPTKGEFEKTEEYNTRVNKAKAEFEAKNSATQQSTYAKRHQLLTDGLSESYGSLKIGESVYNPDEEFYKISITGNKGAIATLNIPMSIDEAKANKEAISSSKASISFVYSENQANSSITLSSPSAVLFNDQLMKVFVASSIKMDSVSLPIDISEKAIAAYSAESEKKQKAAEAAAAAAHQEKIRKINTSGKIMAGGCVCTTPAGANMICKNLWGNMAAEVMKERYGFVCDSVSESVRLVNAELFETGVIKADSANTGKTFYTHIDHISY